MGCKQIRLIGDQRCEFYGGRGICKLPCRIYCTEYQGERKPAHIESISPSGLDNYRSCEAKWLMSTFKGIQAPDIAPSLAIGRIGHMGLAEYYKGGQVNLKLVEPVFNTFKIHNYTDEKLKVASINLAVLLEHYFRFYPPGEFPNAKVEQPLPTVEVDLRGYSIHGYVDLLCKDTVVEHKFLDSVELDSLRYRTQKILYLLATGADKVIFNILKKPGTYRKKNETFEDYKERVSNDVSNNPTKFFARKVYYKSLFDMEEEKRKVADTIDKINEDLQKNRFAENDKNCMIMRCGYEPICTTGVVSEAFIVKKDKPKTSLKDAI